MHKRHTPLHYAGRKYLQPLLDPLSALVHSQSFGGLLLAAMAALALIISNSPWAQHYTDLLGFRVQFRLGDLLDLNKPLLVWVNDLWMAVFFFLVGLEIKRELLEGELASRQQALLPAIAAVGGMVLPALIYYFINRHDPVAVRGWAIPSATDIAFALGILILLGSRVPHSLKVLLTAIAIIDDLGAILVIAFFYTEQLNTHALQYAAYCVFLLIMLNRLRVARIAMYVLVGAFLWLFLLKSGIHATLAGVLTALAVPLYSERAAEGWSAQDAAQGDTPQFHSPLKSAEHALHPWVAYLVLPVFAFLNAGVNLQHASLATLGHSIPLGIIAGLVVGKAVGIFGSIWLVMKFMRMQLPPRTQWAHLLGMSMLCGVGFTMSLFIGGLAFAGLTELETELKLGVLCGSLLSGILGSICILLVKKPPVITVVKS